MCLTSPFLLACAPSTICTGQLTSSLLSRQSSATAPLEVFLRPIIASSTVSSSPEVDSTLKDECSTLTITPTDERSSITMSCSANEPSDSSPAETSLHSCTCAACTTISLCERSEKT